MAGWTRSFFRSYFGIVVLLTSFQPFLLERGLYKCTLGGGSLPGQVSVFQSKGVLLLGVPLPICPQVKLQKSYIVCIYDIISSTSKGCQYEGIKFHSSSKKPVNVQNYSLHTDVGPTCQSRSKLFEYLTLFQHLLPKLLNNKQPIHTLLPLPSMSTATNYP